MLVCFEKNVKLNKQYSKVLHIMPANNNTYCMLATTQQLSDCIVHFNVNGEILYEQIFTQIVDEFGMLQQNEAVVLETRNNCITIISLDNYSIRRIPYYYINEEIDQSNLYTFPDTHYLCICQNGRFNDNRFKISYFKYPLDQNDKPFKTLESQQIWTYQYQIQRTNNHSQFIWYKPIVRSYFQFYLYDLRQQQQLKLYKIINPYFNQLDSALVIMNVWQLRRYQFMFVCDPVDRKKDYVFKTYLIIDVRLNVVKESKFHLPDPSYQNFLIDCKYMGNASMFRTFNFTSAKSVISPIYYMDNQTQALIAEQSWICSYKTKYQFPGYDTRTLIESQYENQDVSEIKIKQKKIASLQQTYLHMLLEINQNFDKDLLQQVIEMIDYTK